MNAVVNKKTKFIDLTLIDYKEAWDYQAVLFQGIVDSKLNNRAIAAADQNPTENYLIFCEHPHVFTLGKTGDEKNLLVTPENLRSIGATYYRINRGGDITYHGPGQVVGYPILDLENFFTDIHRYMRTLEEAIIQTLSVFGIASGRIPGLTGVWLDPEDENRARKICALGVKTSRWVTMHGFAFNVNTNLRYFDYIVPCGISGKGVTSMQQELGTPQDLNKVRTVLKEKIAEQFGMEWL